MLRTLAPLAFAGFVLVSCRTSNEPSSEVKDETTPSGERAAQLYRFDPWLKTIGEALDVSQGQSPADVADELISGPQRIASYNLQALGRLYGSESEQFKQIRDDFKDMEDGIGTFDKWNNVLKKAQSSGASQEVITKLRNKRKKALDDLTTMLTEGAWIPAEGQDSRLDVTQGFLDGFSWRSYDADRELMLKKLQKELKGIKETTYDMKKLEEGDGLHELRRDWKWIAIEMRVLNGMVTFRPNAQVCPVAAYQDLVNQPVAQSKYAKLPREVTEVNPCLISQCLYVGLAQLIEDLGALKDKAETILNSQPGGDELDEVPEEIRAEAEAVYQAVVANDLAGQFSNELAQCQPAPTEPTGSPVDPVVAPE